MIVEILTVSVFIANNLHKFPAWGRDISVAFGTVTNIKRWVNETGEPLEVWKIDKTRGGMEDHYRIPAGQTMESDMWIPWTRNRREYGRHHATLKVGDNEIAYLYQNGGAVWISENNDFGNDDFCISGVARPGGERTLVVGNVDGNVGLRLGLFP